MLSNTLSALHEEIDFARATMARPRLGKPQSSFLVNGSPKSGTTWMVRMLGSLPGYHRIGNLQGDLTAYRKVQLGSILHGHEVLSDELCGVLAKQRIRAVLMLRDPRDQAVSRMFHILRNENHPGHFWMKKLTLDQALMHSIQGHANKIGGTSAALRLTDRWLKSRENIAVVKYELLHADTERTLQKTLIFLDLVASDQLIRAVVFRNRFERLSRGRKFWRTGRELGESDNQSHFRKGIVGDWRNYFNEAHKQVFKEIAGDALIDLGYETSLDW